MRPANSTAQGIISAGHGIGRVAWVQRYSTPSMPSVITPPATAPYAGVGRARRARTAATSAPPSRLGGHGVSASNTARPLSATRPPWSAACATQIETTQRAPRNIARVNVPTVAR